VSIYTEDKQYALLTQHYADILYEQRQQALVDVERAKEIERREKMYKIRAYRSFNIGFILALVLLPLLGFFVVGQCTVPEKATEPYYDEISLPPGFDRQEFLDFKGLMQYVFKASPTYDQAGTPWLGDDSERYVNTMIHWALELVEYGDVDHDGKSTCVDYVIQFWKYFPYHSKVRIIWNVNRTVDPPMNHVFAMVDGRTVECGAYVETPWRRSGANFNMAEIKGRRYNSRYNRDITPHMQAIIAGNWDGWR
jgi:hypothetical protein